ncbi:hypothetical protein FISHEDRAFT_54136 [Fistulina hepatica ATCC 64428]|uniref:Auxin efflux carrier n=1 Tax=Fistulina hepatica ATCC 64428 TaxID=1128425 RepID=A0A0D6ZZU1_9AGAR|nr:hypothetical protein FISHEDRAFT_54136 [Fistulina hepatica ATCC 64428]
MASAGFLIYSGVMPLLKMFFTILFGYILERKSLFPPAASRGASQVSMNVALPCLIFSNIVPAFTPSNVSAIGPLALTAVTYILLGLLFGVIIREVCYVPRNFWQGIVIACALSNWGNLPTAVVMTVMAEAPFDPDTDPELGVSYVSIFILIFHISFWVCGAAASLAWDFLPGVPQDEAAQVRIPWCEKPVGSRVARLVRRLSGTHKPGKPPSKHTRSSSDDIREKVSISVGDLESGPLPASPNDPRHVEHPDVDPDVHLARRVSRVSATSRRLSVADVPTPPPTPASAAASMHSVHEEEDHEEPAGCISRFIPARVLATVRPLRAIVTPVTFSLAISIPCALIQDLKALFTNATASGGPSWHGPDGNPPLAFVLDTAEFVGAIAIPLSLILLGASFSRMKMPRPISRLPIPAMIWVTLAKTVILPVIGVFMVQSMVSGGLIPKASLAERFVAMFLSGTPTAVKYVLVFCLQSFFFLIRVISYSQLIVATLYAPEGKADMLSVCSRSYQCLL